MANIVSETLMEEFLSACHRVAQNGLAICSSGNLSSRVDDEHMMITATGAWLTEMTQERVAICRISDGRCLNTQKPSMELGFHRNILSARKDINVVLHFASPCATTLACSKDLITEHFSVIPEIPYYIGPVAIVPYFSPGSADLATAVTAAIRGHNLAILKNHGQVTVGWDFQDALRKALYFEFASSICLQAGNSLQTLEKKHIETLCQRKRIVP